MRSGGSGSATGFATWSSLGGTSLPYNDYILAEGPGPAADLARRGSNLQQQRKARGQLSPETKAGLSSERSP
jgi:hypothetical protein